MASAYDLVGVREITPFTYFKDNRGCIFYCRDVFEDGIGAVLVYYPNDRGMSIQYEQRYTKQICHGYRYEREFITGLYPPDLYRYIDSLFYYDPKTGNETLKILFRNIIEVYSPHQSLKDIVAGKAIFRNPMIFRKVKAAIKQVSSYVSVDHLGFYGGLQCNMVKYDGSMHDIDFLVYGVQYYDAVTKLSRGNEVDQSLLSPLVRQNLVMSKAAIRKGQLSQFKLRAYSETVCDIRIIPSEDDSDYFRLVDEREQVQEIVLKNAVVTQASKSLSLHFSYTIKHLGKTYELLGKCYHFLGAASVGDAVNIYGVLMKDGSIYLRDPAKHYVYVPKIVSFEQSNATNQQLLSVR